MNNLREIQDRMYIHAPGLLTLPAEDVHSLIAEVKWLRKLACDLCSSDVPLGADGYHDDCGERWLCDAASEEQIEAAKAGGDDEQS